MKNDRFYQVLAISKTLIKGTNIYLLTRYYETLDFKQNLNKKKKLNCHKGKKKNLVPFWYFFYLVNVGNLLRVYQRQFIKSIPIGNL